MGTRNLTCVFQNGEYKVAQYGQWDGYPSGQGATILAFLRNVDMAVFREKVSKLSFYTDEELDKIYEEVNKKNVELPIHLSRNTAAKVLLLILADGDLKLSNNIEFAQDSLFCEWAYVVDLDKNRFEIYQGFVKRGTPATPDDRFFLPNREFKESDNYDSVRLVKYYSFDHLPTVEDMVNFFNNREREKELEEDDDE